MTKTDRIIILTLSAPLYLMPFILVALQVAGVHLNH